MSILAIEVPDWPKLSLKMGLCYLKWSKMMLSTEAIYNNRDTCGVDDIVLYCWKNCSEYTKYCSVGTNDSYQELHICNRKYAESSRKQKRENQCLSSVKRTFMSFLHSVCELKNSHALSTLYL